MSASAVFTLGSILVGYVLIFTAGVGGEAARHALTMAGVSAVAIGLLTVGIGIPLGGWLLTTPVREVHSLSPHWRLPARWGGFPIVGAALAVLSGHVLQTTPPPTFDEERLEAFADAGFLALVGLLVLIGLHALPCTMYARHISMAFTPDDRALVKRWRVAAAGAAGLTSACALLSQYVFEWWLWLPAGIGEWAWRALGVAAVGGLLAVLLLYADTMRRLACALRGLRPEQASD